METLTYLCLCNFKVLFYLGQVLVPDRRVLQCCSHCDGGKGVCPGMVVVHSSAAHHNARVANYRLPELSYETGYQTQRNGRTGKGWSEEKVS